MTWSHVVTVDDVIMTTDVIRVIDVSVIRGQSHRRASTATDEDIAPRGTTTVDDVRRKDRDDLTDCDLSTEVTTQLTRTNRRH